MTFDCLALSGNLEDIGFQYGRSARLMIEGNVEYYRKLLNWTDVELREALGVFEGALRGAGNTLGFFDYIAALSEGAGISRDDAAMLQCRSELFNWHAISECTVLVDRLQGEIGQTWDWSSHAARHSLVLDLHYDGRRITTFVEAGQLAKIGINDAGLAVALSILRANAPLRGVPIHWLIPQLLMANSTESAKRMITKIGAGRASHIALLDAQNDAAAFEFGPENHYELMVPQHYAHTNHYHTPALDFAVEAFSSSRPRQATADSLFVGVPDARIDDVLNAHVVEDGMLYREFEPSGVVNFGAVGTVASIVMTPSARRMTLCASRQGERQVYQL